MKAMASLRARSRFILLACLPLLLVRALVPVGFMPMHDAHGDLYLAFCPGYGDAMPPAASAHDPHRGHHGMHAHGDHGAAPGNAQSGHESGTPHHDLCPFALSAGPALAHAAPDPAVPPSPIDAAVAPDFPTSAVPSIHRAQSARAPPAPRIA